MKERLLQKMQAAKGILINTRPGDCEFSHHGFFSVLITDDDKYRIQVAPRTYSNGEGRGLPAFIIVSELRSRDNNWGGLSQDEVDLFLECARQVAPVGAYWNGAGTSTISIAWNITPSDLILSGKGVDIPQSYHAI